jgi:VWFA-related protein
VSAKTRHGGGTKATKITKTKLVFFVVFVSFVILLPPPWRVSAMPPWRVSPHAQQTRESPPTQAQQRPVFRGGTHFVRVDAYPAQDGKIVEGLRPEDFEIFEDGKRQQIESFDFIRFDAFTPESARRDPATQREGFDLAADPRYRVFVIVVHLQSGGISYIQDPLTQFLDRVLGGSDLFGLLTTAQSAHDLVLGQKSTTARALIADFWRSAVMDRQPADDALDRCGPAGWAVKGRYSLDQTYVALESLVGQLGSLRQERKNLIFVANGLPNPPAPPAHRPSPASGRVPKIGVANGRIGIDDHPDARSGTGLYCSDEIQRLYAMDFQRRFRDLLTEARRQNVSFYAITPAGLQAPLTPAGRDRVDANNDSLLTLAHETDGIAIVNTNDLARGMRRIGDDLAAYYVLGYYTTNTRWDGNIRRIQVRDRRTGQAVRARREYRAPTAAEIAALAAPPKPPAASKTDAHPASAQGSPVDTAQGGPSLLGEPILTINGRRSAALTGTRTDRVRIEWPVAGAIEQTQARLLDRRGLPLAVPVSVDEITAPAHRLVVDLRLAPLGRGEYSLEITAAAGAARARQQVPIKIE